MGRHQGHHGDPEDDRGSTHAGGHVYLWTERAARQYQAVEPENRLVARELERRWDEALQNQRKRSVK